MQGIISRILSCRIALNRMKKYKDTKLENSLPDLATLIILENKRQLEKWGVQKATLFEWLGWAVEEFGEFSKAERNYPEPSARLGLHGCDSGV